HGPREASAAFPGFFGFLARFFPAGDALGVMFHIGVTELLGGGGALFVSGAAFIAAVRDDERGFVGGQERSELGLVGLEIDRAGDVALLVGVGAIDIDDGHLAGGDGRLEVFMG